MRYKILFISSWFPNKLEPTNGNFVQRHAEAAALLHDVEILHAIGDSAQKESFIFDEKNVNGVRTLIVYYQSTNNSGLNFFRRMQAYHRGFREMQRPDVVHANVLQRSLLFAVYLKRKYKIPFVVTEHWSGFLAINRHKLSRPARWLAGFISKEARFVLPVSHYLKEDLRQLDFSAKMEVMENVVDTDLFCCKDSKPHKFTFLHISNLVPLKNPEKIIRAAVRLAEKFPDFELHIGGDGDLEQLNHLIENQRAGQFIKTFGMLTLPEVAERMRGSDCFILFSAYENFPCVLLESLSCGTPAIATRVGGIPEIINPGNGVLIENNEEQLYAALRDVLQGKIVFDEPRALHDYVEDRFSMRVIAEKFDAIYRSVVG